MKKLTDILMLQPNMVVVNRLKGFNGDFASVEEKMPMLPPRAENWEYCLTINGNWGYTPRAAKPFKTVLRDMITVWSWGGNVLLNVGPDSQGRIPAASADYLRRIGNWMNKNGDAIYGAEPGPIVWLPWGVMTRKGDMLYLHVFHWPADGVLKVPLKVKAAESWVHTDHKKNRLNTKVENGRVLIRVPEHGPDSVASVVAMRIAGKPLSTYTRFPGTVMTSDGRNLTRQKGVDGIKVWQKVSAQGWIAIDLGKEETNALSRIGIVPKWRTKVVVKDAAIEIKKSGVWKPIVSGICLHEGENVVSFAPVKAREIRFSFAGMAGVRDIDDFGIYPQL